MLPGLDGRAVVMLSLAKLPLKLLTRQNRLFTATMAWNGSADLATQIDALGYHLIYDLILWLDASTLFLGAFLSR